MESLQSNLNEYKKQMEKGTIQKAYKGLMEYILDLRTYFNNKYLLNILSPEISITAIWTCPILPFLRNH